MKKYDLGGTAAQLSVMNFLLIEPSQYRRLKSGLNARSLGIPPLGLAYLSAALKPFGQRTLIDISVSSMDEVKEKLSGHYDFILFSLPSFGYYDACELIDDFELYKKSRLMIGGPHVAIERENVFSTGKWDYAVLGEGENVISEFLKQYPNVNEIPGLMSRKNPICSPPRRIMNLDKLPYPDYTAFSMERYARHAILTSRGCPYKCSFCAISTIWGRKWRVRDLPNVVEEMAYVKEQYGEKVFHINDDNLLNDPERAIEFTEIIRKKGRLRWEAQGVRADKVNRKLFKEMKKSGCIRVSIGVESADSKVLKAIGKKEKIEQIEKAIWMSRDAGIEVLAMFVLGTSEETPQSSQRTFNFIRKNTLFPFDIYHLIPYPGTLEWERYTALGQLEGADYKAYNHYSHKAVVETAKYSFHQREQAFREAKLLHVEMDRKWYIRKHLRALNPIVLFRRPWKDIAAECLFYFVLPYRICRRYVRKFL